ncbi:MAG: SusC/RagA family TonB-linked outer membrane protein [Bacteroidota bacterium]
MKNFFFSMIVCLLVSMQTLAQKTVSGTVTDDLGDGLPGVNVLIKGTTNGTQTDLDGNYRLTVNNGDLLVFSYVGFETQEVDPGARTVIDIAMGGATELQEIVVTAIGIERNKKSLAYSVGSLESEKIQQISEPDVLRSMQGKIPGVQISGSSGAPGSATKITIRGNSSIFGDNDPLFVIDGIPYNNTQYNTSNQLVGGGAYSTPLSNLDPNSIASINVLKGAAAAALYGSRAANGVILITTKSASGGLSKKGLEVQVSSSYSVEDIANLPDYQNIYGNGSEFNFQNSNGSWGPAFSELDSIPMWGTYANAFPDLPTNIPYEADPDNVEQLFRKGSVIENSIQVTGGNGQSTFSGGVSHLMQDGYIPHSSFDRTTINIGARTQLDNGFNFGGTATYSTSEQNGPFFGENGAAGAEVASSFARTLWLGRTWSSDLPYETPSGGNVFYNTNAIDNPRWSWKNNRVTELTDRITMAFDAGYDITDWLSVTYKIGTNQYTIRRDQIYNIGSNAFSGNGAITSEDISFEELNSDFLVTATRDIGSNLDLRVIVGQNLNQRTTDRQSTQGVGFVVPEIFDIDNTSTVTPNGGIYSKRRLMGLFYEASIGFNDYLFFNTTGRNDWSSTLPADERSFFYPSASLSFVFTEGLNIDSKILSFGKLRASAAKVGNDAPVYSLTNTFIVNQGQSDTRIGAQRDIDFPIAGQSAATLYDLGADPELTPEFTTEYEFGVNLRLFKDRVDLDVTYYDRNTTDQIGNISVPSATGFQQITTNFGDVENKGWEVGLNVIPVQTTSGFVWSMFVNYTRNRNNVIELADGVERVNIRNLFGGGIRPIAEPGSPLGSLYGTRSAKDDEGNMLIDPSTGWQFQAVGDERFGIIGDPNPNYTLDVTNTLSFKGITFNFLISYKDGGDIYSTTVERLMGRGVVEDTEDREASRIIPGFLGDPQTGEPLLDESGNKIPNTIQVTANDLFFVSGGNNESFFINSADEGSVFDGTVIRLREISLGYDIPQSFLQKTPFGSANVSISGRNLWYFAPNIPHSTNFDPEVNGFGASNTQGIEYASAPQSKRYGVNLRFTF